MSVQALAWVFEHSQAELADRLVLLAIANHADNHNWTAWPSITQIGHEAKVSRATVYRALTNLTTLGELHITNHGRGRGNRNHYRIPQRSQPETQTATKRSQPETKKVSSTHKKGLTSETRTISNHQRTAQRSQNETQRPQPQEPTRCTTCHHLTWDCLCVAELPQHS